MTRHSFPANQKVFHGGHHLNYFYIFCVYFLWSKHLYEGTKQNVISMTHNVSGLWCYISIFMF